VGGRGTVETRPQGEVEISVEASGDVAKVVTVDGETDDGDEPAGSRAPAQPDRGDRREPLDELNDELCRVVANFGNAALPAALIAAAFWEPLKYLTAPPAFAVTLALCIAAWGGWAGYLEPGGEEEAER